MCYNIDMPRVKVADKEVVVIFQHGQENTSYAGRKKNLQKPVDYTKCIVLVGDNGCRDENKQKVGESKVVRHPMDVPNRSLAKQTALKRVLDGSSLTKDERAAAWSLIKKPTVKN